MPLTLTTTDHKLLLDDDSHSEMPTTISPAERFVDDITINNGTTSDETLPISAANLDFTKLETTAASLAAVHRLIKRRAKPYSSYTAHC
ncbi:unnamed protein product [Linum trigynum]|uniref:Uncharacterized protein n=1 Tax=Linum trigynum TaxID=586398 RepID=A0AAV2E0Z3_9ROSI